MHSSIAATDYYNLICQLKYEIKTTANEKEWTKHTARSFLSNPLNCPMFKLKHYTLYWNVARIIRQCKITTPDMHLYVYIYLRQFKLNNESKNIFKVIWNIHKKKKITFSAQQINEEKSTQQITHSSASTAITTASIQLLFFTDVEIALKL